jgi:adenylate cyclase
MGLQTGEAIVDAYSDLFGRHVNLAARVANLADRGQIVASLVTREIAAGRDETAFAEPQRVELKGFAEPQIA